MYSNHTIRLTMDAAIELPTRLLTAAVLCADLLLIWVIARLTSRPCESELKVTSEAVPRQARRVRTRRAAPLARAGTDAILIDVNNIRGGLRFDRDVDEMVSCLVRWSMSVVGSPYVILEVDHGPEARTFALAGTRCLICFAGPKMEADDTIVCGVHFCCVRRGERVLVASSDSNLRTRCAASAVPVSPGGVATLAKSHPQLSFLHRTSFSDLPAPGSRHGGALEDLILGPASLSPREAAALRVARREKAGKKTELTAMRVEQAEVLFRRLSAAVEPDHRGRVSVPRGEVGLEVADGCLAHAAWLNEPVGLDSLRRRLKAEMDAYWDSKLFG
jgi:hypothetical protein